MNQKIKRLWLAALRDPKTKQTKGKLRDQNGFCCLGVLCDIYSKEKGVAWGVSLADGVYSFLGHYGRLPDTVLRWAGLATDNPQLNVGPVTPGMPWVASRQAASHNDAGRTFAEIADAIEEQL